MAHNAAGKYIGLGLGDTDNTSLPRDDPNWEAVTLINHELHGKYQWARDLGVTDPNPTFDEHTAAAIAEFDQRVGITPTLDVNGDAVATFAVRTRLGSYPPPPPPTHVMYTVRGTGGIIGQDYTSQVAQALPGTYHEVPINYPASMGGIPVGVSTSGPSGDDCADIANQMLTDAVLSSTSTFAVCGYSLGNKGVVEFLNALFDPTNPLNAAVDRFVCAVLIADPWRPFGKSFYLGPVCSGQGIGTPYFTMSAAAQTAMGWRCCWLAQENDMYTNSPLGATGQVLADAEQIVLGTDIDDPLQAMGNAATYLLQMVAKDGGLQTILGLPAGATPDEPTGATPTNPISSILGGLLGTLGGTSVLTGVLGGSTILTTAIANLLLPLIEGLIVGISGYGTNMPAGVGADTQAAILALKFFGGGIRGHLTYDVDAWSANSPQTFLQLGMQHAADWGARVPVVQ